MFGPIEFTCDAPPYPIVLACYAIGVERSADVRWRRLGPQPWWGRQQCCQGTAVPKLAKFRFTYSSGDEVTYSVGQCSRCGTVWWTE